MESKEWRAFHELFAIPLRNGLTRPKAVRGSGVKMVNMGEIFAHNRIDHISMDRVPVSEKEAETYLLKPDDLLFARQSLVLEGAGKCSIFLGDNEPVTFESHLIRARLDKDIADPHFYYYYFTSPSGRRSVATITEQLAAAGIRGSDLAELQVPYPFVGRQRSIARVLGALDNKIELNRQMNQTLEAMAQALFKSWFVDFDPVTAKAAGRKPYRMNESTAALFPDRFEESESELIPEGWQIGKVSDFANVTSGKRPGNRSQTRTPEINIPLFGGGGVMGYAEKPLFDLPILLTGRVGTLGEIFRITYPCWASDNTLVLLSTEPQFYEYLYFQLLDIDFQSLNRGSTQPLVTQGDLQKQSLLLPSPEVLKAFSKATSKLFDRCDSNDEENNTLVALRDALLPKLLSGEIRVRQAENLVAEVV